MFVDETSDGIDRSEFTRPMPVFEHPTVVPSEPFHGGFGLLTLHGIAKPVYRAFQLLKELGTERLLVDCITPSTPGSSGNLVSTARIRRPATRR